MARKEGGDPRVAGWWHSSARGRQRRASPPARRVSARVRDSPLILSGELLRGEDRDELLRQARARLGHGFREVDVTGLRLADQSERRNVLEQIVIAAYPDPTTARRAGEYMVEHARIAPKDLIVVDRLTSNLRQVLPMDFIADARNAWTAARRWSS